MVKFSVPTCQAILRPYWLTGSVLLKKVWCLQMWFWQFWIFPHISSRCMGLEESFIVFTALLFMLISPVLASFPGSQSFHQWLNYTVQYSTVQGRAGQGSRVQYCIVQWKIKFNYWLTSRCRVTTESVNWLGSHSTPWGESIVKFSLPLYCTVLHSTVLCSYKWGS